MSEPKRATRRGFVALAAMAIPAQAVLAQDATPASPAGDGPVAAPTWSFQLVTIQEPYTGTLQVPQEIPTGNRVVAIEIEVVNDSDQALNFTPIDVRLRDMAGTEYRGGAAIGTEPMINLRNLNPGERSRGWVWFLVPENAQIAEVVYIAPQPQFRVPLE